MKTTLSAIRAAGPCVHGWKTLLDSLDLPAALAMELEIDFLDILESNGLADTLWCARTVQDRTVFTVFALECAISVNHLHNNSIMRAELQDTTDSIFPSFYGKTTVLSAAANANANANANAATADAVAAAAADAAYAATDAYAANAANAAAAAAAYATYTAYTATRETQFYLLAFLLCIGDDHATD